GKVTLNEPGDYNMGILILNGSINVNGESNDTKDFVLFKNEDGAVNIEATSENVKIFVLSGEPINEPIAAGGPFVMNTKEELRQANEDFSNGKFGKEDF
ncbi:MAG TPA: short-chain dehydrogenase, partial [Clostridiales bacterium]|nr:short-chain dehydrogenase [Clostridiales bacterium]